MKTQSRFPARTLSSRRRPRALAGSIAASLAGAALWMLHAQAATFLWLGNGVDGNWSTTGNFSQPTPFALSDDLQFAGNNYLTTNNHDTASGTDANSLTFNAGAGAFTLNGAGGLSVEGGGITNLSSNLQTISLGELFVKQTQTWDAGTAGLHITSPFDLVTLGGSRALTVTGAGNTTIDGGISEIGFPSNHGSLIKTGAGTLTLTATNSYTGGTTVNAGLINFAAANNFGTGNITLNGGGLQWATGNTTDISIRLNAIGPSGATFDTNGNNVTLASALTGTGGITKQGTGTLTLSGANTYTGGTNIGAGTLSFANGSLGSIGAVDFTGTSTLQWNGSNTQDISSRLKIEDGVTATLDTNGNNVTLASTLQLGTNKTGALIKTGAGTLTLTAVNTYTGGTGINAGTLSFANGALGSTGTITFQGNSTLQWTGTNTQDISSRLKIKDGVTATIDTNGNNVTFATALQVGVNKTGALTKTGAGALTLSVANTYTGGTNINAGTLVFALNALGTTGTVDFTGNSTLRWRGTNTQDISSRLKIEDGVNATFDTNGNNVTFASALQTGVAGTGSLTKAGTGILTLSAANTYKGSTTIAAGTIANGVVNALATTTDLILGTANSATTGTYDLNGKNQTVNSISLATGNTGGAGNTITSNAGAATLTVSSTTTDSIFGGAITGPLTLVKDGAGTTLTLTANNTYTGGTTITAGTLQIGNGGATGRITGDVTDNGTLAFNRTGSLVFGGDISGSGTLTQLGTGTTILTGTNTFNGGTTITAGTLQIGNGGTAGSIKGKITDNGALAVNETDTVTLAGVISGSGTFTQMGTGKTILTGNDTYTGVTTITAGTLQIGNGGTSGSIKGDVTDNAALAVNRTDSLTLAGDISGSGSFTQLGTGTTILTGANTYGGGTTITAGTLQIGKGGTAGSITGDVTDNATLAFNRSNTMTFAGSISGSGSVTQLGTGTTILTGSNTYSGGTVITDGTLQIGKGGTAGSITGDVTDNAILAFDRSDTVTFGSVVSGSGSVAQRGAGTTILTGENTYTGGTTVASGVLQVGNGGTSGSIKGKVIDKASLVFNHSDTVTFSGVISGTGSVTQLGTGTTILTQADPYTGGTTISAGTLQIGDGGGSGRIEGPVTNNSSLVFNRSDSVNMGVEISGTGSVTQLGTGTTVLTKVNSYTGGTTITAGTLQIGNGGDSGRLTGNVVNNGTFAFNRSDLIAFDGDISGTGSFKQLGAGTTILKGTNTYTGGTTISAGKLEIGDGGTSGSITGDVTDDGALIFNRSDAVTFGGKISGAGSVTQRGAGSLILTAASTYAGGTTIAGGTLLVKNTTGSATGSGKVSVDAGATLGGGGTIGGHVNLNSGGTIAPGLAGAGTTLHASSLLWNGGGTLSLQLGAASDMLALSGVLTKGTAGDYLLNIIDSGGIGDQSVYTLATFTSTTFSAGDFTLALPAGFSAALLETGTSLNLVVAFSATGPVIQNAAPVNTPRIADFTVSGPVVTGGPADDNTVNSLIFKPGGSLTINNALIVTSGNVTTGGGDSAITGGTLFGPNGLHFDVTGNLFLGSRLIGDATLNGGGSLFLDGALYGNFQVLAGLLGGNGTIFGSLFNAGTVSPGHSPGSILVNGNYAQSSTGLLKIEIGGRSAGQFDLLKIGGKASLDGGLQLVRLNNFNLKRGDKIVFLTADQGISGSFAAVSNPFVSETILEPTLVYRATAVELDMVQGSFGKFAEGARLSPNEISVARALDGVVSDRRADALINYLDERKLSDLPGDFVKIDPEQLTSIYTIGVSLATVQSLNLQRRTDDIRAGSSGFSAAGLAVNGTGPGYSGSFGITTGAAGPAGPEGKESKEVKQVAPVDQRWGAFLSGTGEWVSVGNTESARGYDLQSGGFTLGVDYKVCPNFAVGLSLGYTGTTADLTDRGRVWVNGGKIGIYTTTYVGGWYADAAVNGGYNSYDTRRSALQGEARGSAEGGELNVLFGTGYDFKKGGLTFGPTATFNYTYVGLNGFTEHGSLAPLSIHGGNGESLRTAFGFKVSYDWKLGGMVIRPELRAAWQHEFGDATYALDSNFANGAGSAFTVNGPKIGRDSALLSAGFAIQCSERCSTYFYYDGELGRANYHASSVSAGMRVAF